MNPSPTPTPTRTSTTADPSLADHSKPRRTRVLLTGGPLRRAVIYPAIGATTASWVIHGETHVYDLDQANGRGVYRR